MINLREIKEAHHRIKKLINKTPVMTSRTLNEIVKASVFCKCENYQRAGAFKFRGAYNTISQLAPEQKMQGVITHSSGNHAQAVALACRVLGIKAVIVMPKDSSKVKVNATKGYGGEVVFCENNVRSRDEMAEKLIAEHGYTLVHPYDDDQIIRGAGTAALELFDEVGPLDYVFCPVGGGGLLSGTAIVAKSLSPNSKVIAVEPKNADDAFRSYRARQLVTNLETNTIADGLRTDLCKRTFDIIMNNITDIITVLDDEIVGAMHFLWERMKMVVEPSGAVSVAGLLSSQVPIEGKKVGIIISGGNLDLDQFISLLTLKNNGITLH